MTPVESADLADAFHGLSEPALTELGRQLSEIGALGARERSALAVATASALSEVLRGKLTRLLLLELHADRLSGVLTAPDSRGRWNEFVRRAADAGYWQSLATSYPSLQARLGRLIEHRCQAAVELGRRFAEDRAALAEFSKVSSLELQDVQFGKGDSHRGGRTVAVLDFGARSLVYKPRSLSIDRELARLLAAVVPGSPAAGIRVPEVVLRPHYGWAEFVPHRYCGSDAEFGRYYTGLGHWLAIARLLNASDLHAENLIACGPVPVVVDCETLFGPEQPRPPSGYGQAFDAANALLDGTVLRSGLLPGRGGALGWRGVDFSAAGALPDQQPVGEVPQVIDAGTDEARIGTGPMGPLRAANLPSPDPKLRSFWPSVVAGFDELSERLHQLDARGRLAGLLEPFAVIESRWVLRATEVYAEVGRMLWHPVSLHDQSAAVDQARELLRQHGEAMHGTLPPEVIEAELADLLIGDLPYFAGQPRDGYLTGPAGVALTVSPDRVDLALRLWRASDPAIERAVVRATLVSAYLNDGPTDPAQPTDTALAAGNPHPAGLPPEPDGPPELRRRRLAADLMRQLVQAAIVAEDRTATWIAPVFAVTGWSVQPLGSDAYSGLAGVGVVLAGYLSEVAGGRADPVDGTVEALHAVLNSMRLAEAARQRVRDRYEAVRPDPPGLYVGLGSRIWCWLLLRRLGAVDEEGLARAVELARLLPEAVTASPEADLLTGAGGAAVALLLLAEETGDGQWLKQAASFGAALCQAATVRPDGTARWPSSRAPDGLGGFAHGATGIGWALARLAAASGERSLATTAEAAFEFEESLFVPAKGGWLDLRGIEEGAVGTAWCHGSVGIGLASADLLRREAAGGTGQLDLRRHRAVLRRAAAVTWQRVPDANCAPCHGETGVGELLATALDLGEAPAGLAADQVTERVLTTIERSGAFVGTGSEIFSPGLLSGVGGVIYQLLRLHPASQLPSVLVPS